MRRHLVSGLPRARLSLGQEKGSGLEIESIHWMAMWAHVLDIRYMSPQSHSTGLRLIHCKKMREKLAYVKQGTMIIELTLRAQNLKRTP